MRKLILKVIANMMAFYCAAKLFPAIGLNGMDTVVWAGLILGGVNLLVRPILFLITLPVNFLTLGFFSLVINTWMVMLTDSLLRGLQIPGFWPALATAIIVSVCNMVLLSLEKGND